MDCSTHVWLHGIMDWDRHNYKLSYFLLVTRILKYKDQESYYRTSYDIS